MKAYTVHGKDSHLDASQFTFNSTVRSHQTAAAFPDDGWKDITKAAVSLDFGMSQILAYFVTRSVTDGKLASDVKSIGKSAENLFRCGHIQNI